MVFTKKWLMNKSAGTTAYTSVAQTNKIVELKNSGDIISVSADSLSDTLTQITMVFKDEVAHQTWQQWTENNVQTASQNYNQSNNITVVSNYDSEVGYDSQGKPII
jgi:hypothetical protein